MIYSKFESLPLPLWAWEIHKQKKPYTDVSKHDQALMLYGKLAYIEATQLQDKSKSEQDAIHALIQSKKNDLQDLFNSS